MSLSIYDRYSVREFTLQSFLDPKDILAKEFNMTRKQIFFRDTQILGIDIHHDSDDYSVFWRGDIGYEAFLDEVSIVHKRISKKAEKVLGSHRMFLKYYDSHILFTNGSRHDEKMIFPFEMDYYAIMADRGMTFLRINTELFDVWTNTEKISESQNDIIEDEIGWTSGYNFPEELTEFFLHTTHIGTKELHAYQDVLEMLLSTALDKYKGL